MGYLIQPYTGAVAVTPTDGEDIPPTSGLWVSASGTLKVTMVSGDVVAFPAIAGHLAISVKRVWATGTSATGIIALRSGSLAR